MGMLEANGPDPRRRSAVAILPILLIFLGLSIVPIPAAESFWGCLIYASNAGARNELPDRLNGYDMRMSGAFGYSRFSTIAQRQTALQAQKEAGLVFSDDLKIMLTGLTGSSDGKYLIKLLFVEGKEPVMETQARVSRDSPLFIRGPSWRDGQIIIVVMVATSQH
jgi:hypothetical protein